MTFAPSDVIALVSVAGTVLVALASAGVNLWQARAQRDHERALAFEGRAWELKSAALFSAIRHARGLLDAREVGDPLGLALRVHAFRDEAVDFFPLIEAYGSEAARERLSAIRAALRFEPARECALEAQEHRARKVAALDGQDFVTAATARDEEEKHLDHIRKALDLPSDFDTLLVDFIDAARESVRRPED